MKKDTVMFSLKKNRRRIKRLINLLHPCFLLWGLLSFSALIFILIPPTPVWQYIIGLPVACLAVYWYLTGIQMEFIGEYERVVIRTNMPICQSGYWDSYEQDMGKFKGETIVKTNFSAGYYLLDNIEIIEKMLLSQGIRTLSSFYEESSIPQWNDGWDDYATKMVKESQIPKWHATHDCIHTLSNIENSIGKFIELSTAKSANVISPKDVLGIQKDCREFIEILKNLSENELPFNLALLSESHWNSTLHFEYRELGYCI